MPQDGIQLLSRVPLTREHGLEGGEGIFVGNRHGANAGGLELDLFAISHYCTSTVTASFGHYEVSGTMYVVPGLHAKIGHVDPELSCPQKLFFVDKTIWSTKFRPHISQLTYSSRNTCM